MGWVGMGGDGWLWVGEGGQDANDDWQELLPVYVHVKSKDPETHPSPPIDPEPVLCEPVQYEVTPLPLQFSKVTAAAACSGYTMQVPFHPHVSIPSAACIQPWILTVQATNAFPTQPSAPRMQSNSERMAGCAVTVNTKGSNKPIRKATLRQRHAAATLCKFPSTLTYQFRQQHAFSRGY